MPGIARRKHASEPAVGGVVDGQRCLHASEPFVSGGERIEGSAQLIGLRHVLRIIDHGERPLSEWQRRTECLRLGARPNRRRRDDRKGRPQFELRERLPGVVIVGFEDELHVELFWRIVRYVGANATNMSFMT